MLKKKHIIFTFAFNKLLLVLLSPCIVYFLPKNKNDIKLLFPKIFDKNKAHKHIKDDTSNPANNCLVHIETV